MRSERYIVIVATNSATPDATTSAIAIACPFMRVRSRNSLRSSARITTRAPGDHAWLRREARQFRARDGRRAARSGRQLSSARTSTAPPHAVPAPRPRTVQGWVQGQRCSESEQPTYREGHAHVTPPRHAWRSRALVAFANGLRDRVGCMHGLRGGGGYGGGRNRDCLLYTSD